MDPNIVLRNIIETAKQMNTDYDDEDGNGIDQETADDLATQILNLHNWILNGGFLPEAWISNHKKDSIETVEKV